jgi:hypothetical protein
MFRYFRRKNDGAVALEASLVMPMLLAMLFGIWDWSSLIFQQLAVQSAADAGATFAAGKGSGIFQFNLIQNIFDGIFLDMDINGVVQGEAFPTNQPITGTANYACVCPNGTAGITNVGFPPSGIPLNYCQALPNCSNGFKPGLYVQISAIMQQQSICNYLGFFPATVQSGLVLRIQ